MQYDKISENILCFRKTRDMIKMYGEEREREDVNDVMKNHTNASRKRSDSLLIRLELDNKMTRVLSRYVELHSADCRIPRGNGLRASERPPKKMQGHIQARPRPARAVYIATYQYNM